MTTTKERAAMQQALEALENLPALSWIPEKERDVFSAMTALREALAGVNMSPTEQAEQEPMAIIEKEAGFETEVYATGYADSLPDGVFKLYAAPVRTKDLTDDEIMKAWNESDDMTLPDFARAVIAADREKNK